MATKKGDVFVTKGGLEIKIKRVNPVVIQLAMTSVEFPKVPTYRAKTIAGRITEIPMDAESAKEVEGGLAKWQAYQDELNRAVAIQNERVMTVAFMQGTEFEIPEDQSGWAETLSAIGVDPGDTPGLRRARYLMTTLDPDDLSALLEKIMTTSQVPEEAIKRAEESFRD
ncbi:MAG: hypothetical protein KatS3mg087_1802 [Patescibacteria group bacterium]|nr:MAG: hypothetical protein KatS3mg087_1802 [Patescibacteria group bacterium]